MHQNRAEPFTAVVQAASVALLAALPVWRFCQSREGKGLKHLQAALLRLGQPAQVRLFLSLRLCAGE